MYELGQGIVKKIKDVILGNNKIDNEPRAFFLKMSGDFMRYTAEVIDKERSLAVRNEAK
jgi:hypothetical protein